MKTKEQVLKANAKKLVSLTHSIGENTISLGKVLVESREYFANQKDFLAWVFESAGIKKSWCFKLMRVYKVFGEDEIFKGVSLNLLYLLSDQTEEIVNQIRATIESGVVLTLSAYKELVKDEEIVEIPNKTEDKQSPEDTLQQGLADKSQKSKMVSSDLVNTKADESKAFVAFATEEDEIVLLIEKIHSLEKEIEDTRKTLENVENKRIAHILPQFNSACLYARLGLSLEESTDKKAINKSYRVLASIYNVSDYKEISTNLLEARDTLLSSIK